jgi:hypothetical protein
LLQTRQPPRAEVDLYRDKARAIRQLAPSLHDPQARDQLASLALWYEKLADYSVRVHDLCGRRATIKPLASDEMIAGESYDSWLCSACGSVIALAARSPASDQRDLPNALITINCPSCDALRYYTMHARRVRRFPWTYRPTGQADAELLTTRGDAAGRKRPEAEPRQAREVSQVSR